jgi:hypothetical protein
MAAPDCRFGAALTHAQRGLEAARQFRVSSRIGMLLGDMATLIPLHYLMFYLFIQLFDFFFFSFSGPGF